MRRTLYLPMASRRPELATLIFAVCFCQVGNASLIYFGTSNEPTRIQRVGKDGTGLESYITNVAGPSYRAMAVDPFGKTMFFSRSDGRIQRLNLDGTGLQTIITRGATDLELVLTAGKLYFAEQSRFIFRANLDGTGLEIAADFQSTLGNAGIVSLAIDLAASKLYFGDTNTNAIYRSSFDGSMLESIIQFGTNVDLQDIEIDTTNGKIYWTDHPLNKVQRANLDGSGIEDVSRVQMAGR